MLKPLAIALQGIGFDPAVVALQGFSAISEDVISNILPGYWENRWTGKKKKEEVKQEVIDYEDDVAILLLLSS